ncbi:MAG: hypothetical protein R2939_11770 [Kofleriaceae bacterium]
MASPHQPEVAPRRWRAYADAVALTLGLNVWVSVVLLPATFVQGLQGTGGLVAGALPLVVLALGLWRRSELALLLAFPAAVLVPIGVAPQIAAAHVYGPTRFALVSLGVAAYLFGVSFFSSFHEPPPPVSTRWLSSAQAGTPPRWKRRERVYWGLFALSLVFPGTLLVWVNFDAQVHAYLGQMYPGRLAQMITMLNVSAIVLWVAIYQFAFLGVLRPHRTGDRDLAVTMAEARASAARGRPRARFYFGVVGALLLMAALLWHRQSQG